MKITAGTITHDAFAPFGELVAHRGDAPRRYLEHAHEHGPEADRLRFWVSRIAPTSARPLVYPKLERHPYSAQSFIPLTAKRFAIVVAPDAADGKPELSGARAFVLGAGTGVTYRRAVWHGPMTVLDETAEFAAAMWSAGGPERDDDWFTLPAPLAVALP